MTFWLFLFIYFLGSKLAEYLIVAGHSIRVGRLERPAFGWALWIACVLWPLWAGYLWFGVIFTTVFGEGNK